MINRYFDPSRSKRMVSHGEHRRLVGGMWQKIGRQTHESQVEPGNRPLRYRPDWIKTFADRDPHHFRFEDLEHSVADLPWLVGALEEWGQPRAQQMTPFALLSEASPERR